MAWALARPDVCKFDLPGKEISEHRYGNSSARIEIVEHRYVLGMSSKDLLRVFVFYFVMLSAPARQVGMMSRPVRTKRA